MLALTLSILQVAQGTISELKADIENYVSACTPLGGMTPQVEFRGRGVIFRITAPSVGSSRGVQTIFFRLDAIESVTSQGGVRFICAEPGCINIVNTFWARPGPPTSRTIDRQHSFTFSACNYDDVEWLSAGFGELIEEER